MNPPNLKNIQPRQIVTLTTYVSVYTNGQTVLARRPEMSIIERGDHEERREGEEQMREVKVQWVR